MNPFYKIIIKIQKNQWEKASVFAIVLIYCITTFKTIGLKRDGSYIDSPGCLKNEKATINPKNNDNCFQYALTVALNHQNIEKNPSKNIKN